MLVTNVLEEIITCAPKPNVDTPTNMIVNVFISVILAS